MAELMHLCRVLPEGGSGTQDAVSFYSVLFASESKRRIPFACFC
jgi:hypothetical protein